jgi:superfamily I DNA/RNA helicase
MTAQAPPTARRRFPRRKRPLQGSEDDAEGQDRRRSLVEPLFRHVAPVRQAEVGKGLEFRAVAVMACDEDIPPSPSRIENVADEADLEDVYDTERHLLYVACTRARTIC